MKKILTLIGAVFAFGILFFPSVASADDGPTSRLYTPTCKVVVVDLSGYGGADPTYAEFNNLATVIFGDGAVFQFEFNTEVYQEFTVPGGTQVFLSVDANLNSGDPIGFDFTEATVTPDCPRVINTRADVGADPDPTTVRPGSIDTRSPTSFDPSVRVDPPSSVEPLGLDQPQASPSPVLPAAGVSSWAIAGIATLLCLIGLAALRLSRRPRFTR